jgi:HSP20 family protein
MATHDAGKNPPQGSQARQGSQQAAPAGTSIQPRKGGVTGGLARNEGYTPAFFTGSPFSMMRRMLSDMDRFFDDVGAGRAIGLPRTYRDVASGLGAVTWTPQIDVFERDGQLIVRADLPGMKKDDIRVELDDHTLILDGERRSEHEENQEGLYRSERSYGSFRRTIPLPEGVDAESASASFENGVLEISLKAPQQTVRGRRLEIQEGQAGKGGQVRH